VLRVTADTNLYISALNFGGKPEQLLRLAKAHIIQLIISDAILAEMATVLRCEKFAWPEPEILKAQREIADMSERVQPTETLYIITDDPSDNRILECAAAGEVNYIVSGDKHLLKLEQFRNSPILKVAEFLKRL
jgi:putative PIN family toxin of toxin-antitoxin system